ncbi:CPBP family intramembrane glutamic endopeptidase [Anaeromicrobium sediminis]|uniref:CAAX prenyl protease 2/Lysostaphin resistance protein A-like domain-containing protein n=1 Tax=Anaeromicrobium sediminis TaxID=1478221 RepID=A0A267MNF8_9FIRM|nr:CPBP family intramembrane glutamic endopeptidase [Anaeromicrobium sediminis]PAB60458.1 hypothetical protein CCE28_06060 [Anaeromicrobium sediminis]
MGAILIMIAFIIIGVVISIIVQFFQKKKIVKKNIKYGVAFALILLVLNMVSMNVLDMRGKMIGLRIIIQFLEIIVFVAMGMHYSELIKIRSMPFICKKFDSQRVYEERILIKEEVTEDIKEEIEDEDIMTEITEEKYDESNIIEESVNLKEALKWVIIFVIGSIIYSTILFKIAHIDFAYILDKVELESSELAIYGLISGAAIQEEIVFRLVGQNFLMKSFNIERKNYYKVIIAMSFIWALAHLGNDIVPRGIKFFQIFPMGIGLGWMYEKFGLESCILSHLLFNIIMISIVFI